MQLSYHYQKLNYTSTFEGISSGRLENEAEAKVLPVQIDHITIHIHQPEVEAPQGLTGHIHKVIRPQVAVIDYFINIACDHHLLNDISLTLRSQATKISQLGTGDVERVVGRRIELTTFKYGGSRVSLHVVLCVTNHIIYRLRIGGAVILTPPSIVAPTPEVQVCEYHECEVATNRQEDPYQVSLRVLIDSQSTPRAKNCAFSSSTTSLLL